MGTLIIMKCLNFLAAEADDGSNGTADDVGDCKEETAATVDSIIEIVVNSDELHKTSSRKEEDEEEGETAEEDSSSAKASEEDESVPSDSPSSRCKSASSTKTSLSQRKGKVKGRGRPKQSRISTSLSQQIDEQVGHSLPLFDEEPPTGPNVFYFESDHVALKHNSEYVYSF